MGVGGARTVLREKGRKVAGDAFAPVDHRAEYIEKKRPKRDHGCLPGWKAPSLAARIASRENRPLTSRSSRSEISRGSFSGARIACHVGRRTGGTPASASVGT